MSLLGDDDLEESAIVANCRMNRERDLTGANGYDRELRFNPLDFLSQRAAAGATVRWLDLCCGSGKALLDAAESVESSRLPLEIVGVDLVEMFWPSHCECLTLIPATLSSWRPSQSYDLITCVHGLHYIGDKLQLIARAASWLAEQGRFVANLDMKNIELRGGSASRVVARELRNRGIEYSFRNKLIRCEGRREPTLPFQYLGADDQAGPNYTGQPAVNSHYERCDQPEPATAKR